MLLEADRLLGEGQEVAEELRRLRYENAPAGAPDGPERCYGKRAGR